MGSVIKEEQDTANLLVEDHPSLDYVAEIDIVSRTVAVTHVKVDESDRKNGLASQAIQETETYVQQQFDEPVTMTIRIKNSSGTKQFLEANGFSGLSYSDHENVYTGTKLIKP